MAATLSQPLTYAPQMRLLLRLMRLRTISYYLNGIINYWMLKMLLLWAHPWM